MMPGEAPTLSICIATRDRALFLAEILDNIAAQVTPDVEVVIVDGGSSDDTPSVVDRMHTRIPRLTYVRHEQNQGFDADYASTIDYASGKYCWFMSDDDLLVGDAVRRVLEAVTEGHSLVVVNAQNRNLDMTRVLEERQLDIGGNLTFQPDQQRELFVTVGKHLSFIPAVVILRSLWLGREKTSYFGTYFVHVGVIFQAPLPGSTLVIAEPLIWARQGNTSWGSKAFEIWMFRWPTLVWSFAQFSPKDKAVVFAREPWRKLHLLVSYRGLGYYAASDYRKWLVSEVATGMFRLVARGIARIPRWLLVLPLFAYLVCFRRRSRTTRYVLVRSSFLRFLPFHA